uniref:Ion_trans domain-containing protein n=1 Tax=Gongylonema pulchrum TaxID=637853 RepID=A0A183ELI6_9BILA
LRKRRVRVSKLIRIARLQKVFVDAAHSDVHCRLLNAYLLDQNAADGACQIVSKRFFIWKLLSVVVFIAVSNVYTIKAHTRGRDPHTWIFSTSTGEIQEQSLGCLILPIINEGGHCCLQNKYLLVTAF